MNGSVDERLMKELGELDPARTLESEHPFRASLFRDVGPEDARVSDQPEQWIRRIVAAIAAIVVAVGIAVTPVGAAVSDVATNFAGYLRGDDSAELPGELIPREELPRGMRGLGSSDWRVLAERGEWQLVVAREGEAMSFSFEGGGMVGSPESWVSRLSEQPVFLLASHPPNDPEGSRRPLFGIVAGDVMSVKAVYAQGSDSPQADASGGGFILPLDPDRELARVIAYDRDSRRIASVDPGTFAGRSIP